MNPGRRAESERASLMFHSALIGLGAQTVMDSRVLYQDVPPVPDVSRTRLAVRWLGRAVTYVKRRRLRARDMALAYYRYQRALETGATIAVPGVEPPPYVSLAELKREFETALNPPTRGEEPLTTRDTGDEQAPPTETPDEELERLLRELKDSRIDDEKIPVETIDDLEETFEDIEQEAEEQTRENLVVLGPQNQDRKISRVKYVEENIDDDRDEIHQKAGNRQAAAAARNVMNGARGPLFAIGSNDSRVKGFVRVSRTGTPCGWCAMLISRGPVLKGADRESSLYSSNQGTGVKDDGSIVTYGDLDLYHDNCQCYAVPVYDTAHFQNADIFALNRKYAQLWPEVTKGLSGKSAVSAWRRFIRQETKTRKAQEAAA